MLLAYFLACLLGAGFAQFLAVIPGTGISLWLPSGLLLGALLVSSRRRWIWWILAAVAAELTGNALWFGNDLVVAGLIIVGNVAEALVGALLIGRFVRWPFRLETIRDALAFVLLGAVCAPVVAATIGGLTLAWSEGQPWSQAFALLWVGDATGVLVGAPLLLVLVPHWRRGIALVRERWMEVAGLVIAAAAVGAISLASGLPFGLTIIPVVLLAAVRFYFFGTAATAVVLTVLAALFQLADVHPFTLIAAGIEAHVRLQLFLAIAVFASLVVAALAKQNRETLQQLQAANRELEQRVAERTASLSTSERRLKAMMQTAQVGIAFGRGDSLTGEANAALAALLQRPADELAAGQLTWADLTVELEREALNEELRTLERTGRAGPLELTLRRADGTEVPTIWTATLLETGEHVAFVVDQRAQKGHEAHIHLLMRELSHRAKNTLALVQAVARQTRAGSTEEFLQRFNDRVRAIAAAQDLLLASQWSGADLEGLIRGQLSHFEDALDRRIAIDGPRLAVSPAAAQAIGLAVHELATNAAKYGALANATGRVAIAWTIAPDGTFGLTWTESGGPAVAPPVHRGFGSTVIEAMMKNSLACELSVAYEPAGVRWGVTCPLARVLASTRGETPASAFGQGL